MEGERKMTIQEEIKKVEICERCKKNEATLTFTDSLMSFTHGFKEEICQECYNKQEKESNWYKEGLKVGKQEATNEIIKMIKKFVKRTCIPCLCQQISSKREKCRKSPKRKTPRYRISKSYKKKNKNSKENEN